jgi:DNA-binding transcriptional LysR family regulator
MGDRIHEQMACMAVFSRVVETGSFSAAARSLSLTKSAVSKQVARLEAIVGSRLLHRTTRSLSLTESGQVLYQSASRAVALCREAQGELSDLKGEVRGRLRVTAPLTFARNRLAPLLPELLQSYPQLELQLVLLDREVDLAQEGIDVAVRIASALPQDVIARRLMDIEYVPCASQAYLSAAVPPRHPQELEALNCLRYGEGETRATWRFEAATGGEKCSVRVKGRLAVNNSDILRQAVLDGMGVALLPDYLVEDDISTGRLVRLLPEWNATPPFGAAVYALWLPDRHLPPKARTFLDWMAARVCGSRGQSSTTHA